MLLFQVLLPSTLISLCCLLPPITNCLQEYCLPLAPNITLSLCLSTSVLLNLSQPHSPACCTKFCFVALEFPFAIASSPPENPTECPKQSPVRSHMEGPTLSSAKKPTRKKQVVFPSFFACSQFKYF